MKYRDLVRSFVFNFTIVICSALVCFSAIVAHADSLVVGINRARLLELPEEQWRGAIDDMAAHGVRLLRTNIVPPVEKISALVRYANQRNIDVLLIIPTWLPQFYDVPPLHGRRSPPKLSDINSSRFEAFWLEHRASMKSANARVFAYQLGNEINGPFYNGDYPFRDDAHLLSLTDCDMRDICSFVLNGWVTYIRLLKIIRESKRLEGANLIAGSMAKTSREWAQKTHGYFSTPYETIKNLERLGAGQLVDAYSVQIYPIANADTTDLKKQQILAQLNDIIAECTLNRKTNKACWITEWGFPSVQNTCEIDQNRNQRLSIGLEVLRRAAADGLVTASFLYDWDRGERLSVFRCNALMVPAELVRQR